MKVLYVAFHDPVKLDLASGVDYFHYQALYQPDLEVKFIGPFDTQPTGLEWLIARVFKRTGKRYLKFHFSIAWKASQATNRAVREWQPDVVLTITPAALVFYSGKSPCVYSLDTTFYGQHQLWPLYGNLILQISMWQEKRAFRNCSRILTNSEWSRNILTDHYKIPREKTGVFVLPSALPFDVVPEKVDILAWKVLQYPIRLLLVGRDYRRKGIDIAIETVHKLNMAGIPARLTICGVKGQSDQFVQFVGPYKKGDAQELAQYLDLYRQAHFLIHPAVFEPAGIVPSEAAAFGTPTITNDAGGLATSVANGISGVVLPMWSSADVYAQAITNLVNDPKSYYALCSSARQRYERELNWKSTGEWLANLLKQVAHEHQQPRQQ